MGGGIDSYLVLYDKVFAWAHFGLFNGFKPPRNEIFTVKKPDTVAKCDQIHCKPPRNSKTPKILSWLSVWIKFV